MNTLEKAVARVLKDHSCAKGKKHSDLCQCTFCGLRKALLGCVFCGASKEERDVEHLDNGAKQWSCGKCGARGPVKA